MKYLLSVLPALISSKRVSDLQRTWDRSIPQRTRYGARTCFPELPGSKGPKLLCWIIFPQRGTVFHDECLMTGTRLCHPGVQCHCHITLPPLQFSSFFVRLFCITWKKIIIGSPWCWFLAVDASKELKSPHSALLSYSFDLPPRCRPGWHRSSRVIVPFFS